MPDVPRGADGSALEPADGWCRSSALRDLSTVGRGSEHSRCRWLPPCRRGRRAVLRLLRPPAFPGRMAERTGDDCHGIERFTSRRAQAWPLGKGSAVGKTRSTGLRAQGEPLDRQAAAASVPNGERRTGANQWDGYPSQSFLRRTIVPARAPLHQRNRKYGFAGMLASVL